MRHLFALVQMMVLMIVLILGVATTPAWSQQEAEPEGEDDGDRHELYYYPAVTSSETYVARARMLGDSDRNRRLGFIVGITQEQLSRTYPPPYAMFAKGTEAEKLIIVALDDSYISSLYQARGLLAQLTSIARASPVFTQNRVEAEYTFLDLLMMMGFQQVTISDGRTYAHQIIIADRSG